VLCDLGYNVRGIDWRDGDYRPDREFAAVVDIGTNLGRLVGDLPADCVKILYCTTSDPCYQNAAEAARVRALNDRRAAACVARRLFDDPGGVRRSLEVCDAALLDGNEHTLSTYPAALQPKMQLIGEPGSDIGVNRKLPEAFLPEEREFLWYFGAGAIHKGLDLVLEVFARHPDLVLNVVGNAPLREADFAEAYLRELTECPNIRVYGALMPDSTEFAAVARRCFAFVGASCSESTSSAVVTCLKVGMFPIISRDCGVTLPPGVGTYLETCSIEEIEEAVLAAYESPSAVLAEAVGAVQAMAHECYSRERFSSDLASFLSAALGVKENGTSK
jgi:hypothetical protein